MSCLPYRVNAICLLDQFDFFCDSKAGNRNQSRESTKSFSLKSPSLPHHKEQQQLREQSLTENTQREKHRPTDRQTEQRNTPASS